MTSKTLIAAILTLATIVTSALADEPSAKLVVRAPDPHGSPRPFRDARDVPIRTSLYCELAPADAVDADAVGLTLRPDGGEPLELLRPGREFAEGASGWLKPKSNLSGARALAVYIEPPEPLKPSTRYTATIRAGTDLGSWTFTTGSPDRHPLTFRLDRNAEPVRWHGQFFSGLCNVVFCSKAKHEGPTYDLMAEARKQHPRAWSYQRDFWTTGTEFRPPSPFIQNRLPNIVRERETRRIASLKSKDERIVLHVEDVFGNAQYGIADGRPLTDDYHLGDEILIADGVSDARSKVIAVDDDAHTVTVSSFPTPAKGWKIDYAGPFPDQENPDAPGLFPPGGCYLRKFQPHGTPCYYWGRIDKEYDLLHRHYGRRLMVNFADATGDLSRDGRSWTTVKDLAEWHEVAHAIAGHLIDRYGDDALTFTWSVFNEPDLGRVFWRASWDDLQDFYDYTTDAILRAFEDRGYDSRRAFIGGLELGGIFGTHLKLVEFLSHCSPRAEAKGAKPRNAAFADPRLDGQRSHRVEELCRAHDGRGSPCDFISIHSYNRSELMADKLIRAKEMALEIDPDYYAKLWINSHESCPDWLPPPDEAAADSYRGNGYFPSWCLDVVHRQLAQAQKDARYAYGESILTVWPPPRNFSGLNAITRVLKGNERREVTVPMPIFHVLGMLSDLGDRYWILPSQQDGGHTIAGFASADQDGTLRVVLYAHDPRDTQSRSGATFEVMLDLSGASGSVMVEETRFDRDHNSPFWLSRSLRDRRVYSPAEIDKIQRLCACRPTVISRATSEPDGHLRIPVALTGNGCAFLTIEPAP